MIHRSDNSSFREGNRDQRSFLHASCKPRHPVTVMWAFQSPPSTQWPGAGTPLLLSDCSSEGYVELVFFLYNLSVFMRKTIVNRKFPPCNHSSHCGRECRRCCLKLLEIIRAERWSWQIIPGLGHPTSACLWRKWMVVLIAFGLNSDDGAHSAPSAHTVEPTLPLSPCTSMAPEWQRCGKWGIVETLPPSP